MVASGVVRVGESCRYTSAYSNSCFAMRSEVRCWTELGSLDLIIT